MGGGIAPPAPIGGTMTGAAGGGATTGTVRNNANLQVAQQAMLQSSMARWATQVMCKLLR